eukprot:CAMPEP_0172841524 /NCGR_PEP_ID=MMETSP1075-20121228/30049_1 /TAXON_ID=2916 /ORGANISM="Ceratium fusus, Strain PA161109" /LENGTH=123 /DNA_ID=CAMNT_0013685507 /DNA_START=315 /DNA_END=685 /DNA_ORIENTATION=+
MEHPSQSQLARCHWDAAGEFVMILLLLLLLVLLLLFLLLLHLLLHAEDHPERGPPQLASPQRAALKAIGSLLPSLKAASALVLALSKPKATATAALSYTRMFAAMASFAWSPNTKPEKSVYFA